MIVLEEELQKYLGNNDAKLANLRPSVLAKLVNFRNEKAEGITSITDYLLALHQTDGLSLSEIASKVGISAPTISRIFNIYNLPKKTNAEAVRENWKDGGFRKRQAEATRKNWEDEEFRKRQAEAVREARISPAAKIKGYRADIGQNASSTWEANFGRIIKYAGREEKRGKNYFLDIPERFYDLFKSTKAREKLDFLVKDKRGNLVGYKIVPKLQKKTYAKAELAREQHGIRVKIITEREYQKLENWFRMKIEGDERFYGWETSEDNLKTNPKKYSPTD